MPFNERLKRKVKEKSHYQCCLCKDGGQIGILEIHHIIPQAEGGPDTEDNAVALCPLHHEMFGNDPRKRKMIKEVRDFWYKLCKDKYKNFSLPPNIATTDELEKLRKEILQEISNQNKSKIISYLEEKLKSLFTVTSIEISIAKLYIKQHKYSNAIEKLTMEIQNNPQSFEGYYLLGYIYGEQGDIKKMLKCFNKSLKINSKFKVSIDASKEYHWADNFNKGVAAFNKAAKINKNVEEKDLYKNAVKYFNYAIKCKSNSSDTYKNLAYAYINMGDRDAAFEPYKKVVELTKAEDAYVQVGDLYVQKGVMLKDSGNEEEGVKSFNEAIKVLEEGRKEHPTSGDILLLLSNSYIGANKLDVAKDAFKMGVFQDPNNKFYRYNYGSLLLNAEEYPAAAEQLKKAIEIDGEYENALYNLAVTYVKWGTEMREEMKDKGEENDDYKAKFESALPLLEKYLTIKENEGAVWDLLGKVYANLGMIEKSQNAFEKADKLFNMMIN